MFALKYDKVPDKSRLRVIFRVFPQTELTKNFQDSVSVFNVTMGGGIMRRQRTLWLVSLSQEENMRSLYQKMSRKCHHKGRRTYQGYMF